MEYHQQHNFWGNKNTYLQASYILWQITETTKKQLNYNKGLSFHSSEFDVSLSMASFHIKSLFTNIPLAEALNLCVQNLYRNQAQVGNLSKRSFYSLLKITTFESFFIFDGKFYEQFDGVAMGFPLGPTL